MQSVTNYNIAISDTNTDIYYNIICNNNCRSCLTTNLSYCTSCYINIASISYKYFDNTTHTCLANCASNQYLSIVGNDYQCYLCAS